MILPGGDDMYCKTRGLPSLRAQGLRRASGRSWVLKGPEQVRLKDKGLHGLQGTAGRPGEYARGL